MAFQRGAFQSPGFQQDVYSGGHGATIKKNKFDSEAYAYVYNHADKLRRRVDELPPVVKEAIQEAVTIDNKAERDAALSARLNFVEIKLQRLYIQVLEDYYSSLLDEKLALELKIAEDLRLKKMIDEETSLFLLLL